MEYIIKKCEYEDLEEVACMYNQLAKELKSYNNEEYMEQRELSDNTMLRIIRSAIKECNLMIYVAKHGEEVVGFISGSEKEADIKVSQVTQIGYMEGIYVKDKYRKMEIISKLEEEICKEFKRRGIYFIGLDVLKDNQTAKDVWASSGYQAFCEQMSKGIG